MLCQSQKKKTSDDSLGGLILQKSSEAFRTISEVSRDLNIPKHVLRFWEGKFPQLKPMKRGGGRRYYRLKDIDLLRGIQRLLYYDGYHIRGVQKILRKNGVDYVKTYWQHEEERHHQPDLADIPDLVAHVTDHLGSSFKGQNLQVTGEEDHPQISTSPLLDVKSTEGLSHLLQELETCHKLLVQSSK